MNETERKARNTQKMTELYPVMARKIEAIIMDLEAKGFRPRIQEAYRSPADQLADFNSGHSKLRFGFHNVTGANGHPESLAVDLLDDDDPETPTSRYLLTLAASAASHGCNTGIRWGLPDDKRAAIDAALAARDFKRTVVVGWDPCHVEPAGHTAEQAKEGWRPT